MPKVLKESWNQDKAQLISTFPSFPNFDYLHMIFKSIILVIIIGDFDKNTK